MKQLPLIIILFLPLITPAQSFDDITFLDANWIECLPDTATYYRLEQREGKLNRIGIYYRKNDQLEIQWTETRGKSPVLAGQEQQYFENGKPKQFTQYSMGKKNGQEVCFHENGQLHIKRKFIENVLIGEEKMWYENGQKKKESIWANGVEKVQNIWLKNGNQIVIEGTGAYIDTTFLSTQHGEDTLITTGQYEAGYQTGFWKRIYGNDQVVWQGHYVNQKREGLWEAWYKDGQKMQVKTFENGTPKGTEIFWYPNGKKAFEFAYKDGIPVHRTTFYPDGGIESQQKGTPKWGPEGWDSFGELEPLPLNLEAIKEKIGYPEIAKDAGIQGTVIVRALVTREGTVKRYKIIRKVHPILADAVSRQILFLYFAPAICDGVSVPFWVEIPFKFKLIN